MQDQILVEMPIHGSSFSWNIGTDTGFFYWEKQQTDG